MSDLPSGILGKWIHSFEEDAESVKVYRPPSHKLPPARGRDGLEFKADGGFIDWSIGPGDAGRALRGQWQLQGPSLIRIAAIGDARPARLLEICHCDAEVLMLRQRSMDG